MAEFQGARYEILVASLFARCGFQIGFIGDPSKRNAEFIASKGTEKIAVEAKSRHRAGVLHERGEFADQAPAEIKRLYESALGQNPNTVPFVIFIDVNLPLTPEVRVEDKEWIKEGEASIRVQKEGRARRFRYRRSADELRLAFF
jgi:hypothetical protein